eukprot:13523871-Alexandrium_andersonii.AAC.1
MLGRSTPDLCSLVRTLDLGTLEHVSRGPHPRSPRRMHWKTSFSRVQPARSEWANLPSPQLLG